MAERAGFSLRKATSSDAQSLDTLVNSAYRGESSKQGWTTEADLLDGTRTNMTDIESMIGQTRIHDPAVNWVCLAAQRPKKAVYDSYP